MQRLKNTNILVSLNLEIMKDHPVLGGRGGREWFCATVANLGAYFT